MAESCFKLENPLETMRAEENNSDPAPMVQENAAAASLSVIPDINKKKKKKKIPKAKIFAVQVILLDPWNLRFKHPDEIAARRLNNPGMVKKRFRWSRETYQIDPWHLRETRPDYVPVSMEKDARSEIPDVGMKKYLVPKDGLLGDFVDFFRVWIGLSKKKPIFVFFKNTVPPTGAPMCAIDEENKDEDGFLHMTYSGEENFVCGSSEEEQVKVENAARCDFHGTDSDEKKKRKYRYERKCPIAVLDSWNNWMRDGKKSLEGADLREKYPLCIPVSVEKDAGSDIPDINLKKCLVPSEMPLGEFVNFLQGKSKKPMFVFFKNTQPPTDALMSAIDKKNKDKDDDGYLHVIYSGNDKLCGYFGELKLSS